MMRLIVGLLVCLWSAASFAQTPDQANSGVAINRSTVALPTLITTPNTFQLLLAAQATQRQALTIENNNSTDACYLIINGSGQIVPGVTTLSTTVNINGSKTAQQAAIYLPSGASYQRYWPYVPSDAFYVTCVGTDSVYMDIN